MLLLTAAPLFAIFLIQQQQKKIQYEMKDRLEEQWLLTVSVFQEDVHWIKPGKEIWLKGRMFDIKSSNIKNGTYTFTGLYDEDETMLVKQLQKNQPENTAGNKVLAQLFQLLMSPIDYFSLPLTFTKKIQTEFLATATPLLSTPFISIITPPPQV